MEEGRNSQYFIIDQNAGKYNHFAYFYGGRMEQEEISYR